MDGDVASLFKMAIVVGCGLLFSTTVSKLTETVRPLVPIKLPHELPDWEETRKRLESKMVTYQQFWPPSATTIATPPKFLSEFSAEQHDFFMNTLVPFIQKLALQLPQLFPPNSLYYLRAREENEVVLSREQVACLLANAFLSTFPQESAQGFNFQILLRSSLGPAVNTCLCLLNYFTRLLQQIPTGNIIYRRQCLKAEEIPDWSSSRQKISRVKVLSEGAIESDSVADFHAGFSNKWIGGGLLHGGGYAQEEMLFSLRPECIVVMLLCPDTEAIEDDEAVVISGAECFSQRKGYSASFTYAGDYQENRDLFYPTNSLNIHIVCVDAMIPSYKLNQYDELSIHRELCKLLCGVKDWREKTDRKKQVYATSHWGCGINGGSRQLKAVEQLLALSEAGIDIHYYTYGAQKFSIAFEALTIYLYSVNATVGEVANALLSYGHRKKSHRQTLFEYITEYMASLRNGNHAGTLRRVPSHSTFPT